MLRRLICTVCLSPVYTRVIMFQIDLRMSLVEQTDYLPVVNLRASCYRFSCVTNGSNVRFFSLEKVCQIIRVYQAISFHSCELAPNDRKQF